MPNLAELTLANNQLGNKADVDWRWLFGSQVSILKLFNLIAPISKTQ